MFFTGLEGSQFVKTKYDPNGLYPLGTGILRFGKPYGDIFNL